jgi:hypothetical protein
LAMAIARHTRTVEKSAQGATVRRHNCFVRQRPAVAGWA